jgi:hypothetical protein
MAADGAPAARSASSISAPPQVNESISTWTCSDVAGVGTEEQ